MPYSVSSEVTQDSNILIPELRDRFYALPAPCGAMHNTNVNMMPTDMSVERARD